jgi:hypothetical protein
MINLLVQVSIHLAKQFQRRRFFRNQPMDRDEMSNRGHAIDASYQVLVHLAKQFQRRKLFLIGQSETRIACGGHVW